ncbi:hypothetical protein [Bacillus testis]|uniref:hypothetical protein n=1 Tax=Bacillus testis TaxID=1622072 RepID=UPI00067E73CF|nr:hypothetical protein [Bacillus testis]
MKKTYLATMVMVMLALLSGCMYPQSEKSENKIGYEDQIASVQKAVDQYRSDSGGLLPIKNQEATVPYYQKYPIDFTKLKAKYLAEPPGNAYESGGVFQYVLVDVEKKPTVKIYDLRIADVIQDYHMRLSVYLDKNKYPPYKETLAKSVFLLDYKKLGYKEAPVVESPYTHAKLGLVYDAKGGVYADYTPDLMASLKESKHVYKKGEDIRAVLMEDSFYAPAFSLPYTIDEKNEPVFLLK